MILYVETHFLMSIAKGQDSHAPILLQNTPPSVCIAIPSICCMEALYRLETEQKYRHRFEQELDKQISESSRDKTSPHADSLRFHLEQSRIENQQMLDDIKVRLFDALDQIAIKAEMIGLTGESLQNSLKTIFIEKDLTDNLILHCILNHSSLYPTEDKVFLSGNNNDFGKQNVQEALHNAGVDKYFTRTQNFLGWLQSQPSS